MTPRASPSSCAPRPMPSWSASKLKVHSRFSCCASSSSASCGRASAPNPCIAQATWCAILFPIRPSSPQRWTGSSPSSTRWHRRAAVFEDAVTAKLRAASRESLATVVESLDGVVADLDTTGLTRLGGRSGVGGQDAALARRFWPGTWPIPPANPAAQGRTRRATAVRQGFRCAHSTYSRPLCRSVGPPRPTLIRGIQHIARLALLVRAEREDQIEDVEDQLFRFSRILDSEPRLITLLSEYTRAAGRPNQLAEQRARMRRASQGLPQICLRQTIELLHGERADESVRELANLAVSRRGEVVAHVSAAAELSDCSATTG